MKFGKEFASQLVQEWQEAYMDYNCLKKVLKEILNFRRWNAKSEDHVPKASLMKRRVSLYRAFSGLTNQYNNLVNSPRKNENDDEEVILVSAVSDDEGSYYQTMFLMAPELGGENEVRFFKKLDHEFNKVLQFYKTKVEDVKNEAKELSRQIDVLIALRIKVDKPLVEFEAAVGIKDESPHRRNKGRLRMDAIQEVEMNGGGIAKESDGGGKGKGAEGSNRLAQLKILDHIKVNVEPESPVSTLKNMINSTSDLSFNKDELNKAEQKMKQALVEFHRKLRLLKSYSFLNTLAFSKIMKKYDKITSRNASKSYLEMIDKSYLGSSNEVSRLTERVEKTFMKHFSYGNRRQGMKFLRPQAKKERHRVTFFLGLFSGCSLALIVGLFITIHAADHLNSEGRDRYMNNVFPLYSLFGFIVLHMLMYAGNIYFWRRIRANYPFIFGFKQSTELGYREVLLLASGLSILALAAILSNLDMDMDSITKKYRTLTELVPLALVLVLLLILICPFNIIYRSSRFFLVRCTWHCICAPLYKVTFPDFFLGGSANQPGTSFKEFRVLHMLLWLGGLQKKIKQLPRERDL